MSDFEDLFLRYKPWLTVVARSYVRDQMAAEDIVMDAFERLLEHQTHEGCEPRHLSAYMLTVVKNRCLNYLRDQRRHMAAHQGIHSDAQRLVAQRIATLETLNPDEVFMTEVAEIIGRELDRMPEATRRAFLASRFHDHSHAQIAEELGLNPRQVESMIARVTKTLRAALRDYMPLAAALGISLEWMLR